MRDLSGPGWVLPEFLEAETDTNRDAGGPFGGPDMGRSLL